MNSLVTQLHGVRRRAVLPPPIRALVRRMPHVPSSAVIAAVLNLMVRRRLAAHVYQRLGDRPFVIEVRDLDLAMTFRYTGRRFIPVARAGEAALRFQVNAADFATLAAVPGAPSGRFLHDLAVAGEPELAAEVRQALEGIDVERTRRILHRAARRVEREQARG